MPRASCRCGQQLVFPPGGLGRIVCSRCGATVRLRPAVKSSASSIVGDGYLRFLCPCGRRLKVQSNDPPSHGQCPDCGRVVPVPTETMAGTDPRHPETPTEDLLPTDRARLDTWAQAQRARQQTAAAGSPALASKLSEPEPTQAAGSTAEGPVVSRNERGLRLCPSCGKPLHMAAETCRDCGSATPKA